MGCSVNGVILFDKPRPPEILLQVEQRLKQVVQAATDRGRDSYGFCTLDADGQFRMLKRVGRFRGEMPGPLITSATRIVINNCRAEPTTEYVAEKTEGDIQPFHHSGIIVSHNGTIANDKELKKKHAFTYRTLVDSAVIPPLLAGMWKERTAQGLHESLKTLVGSYALAVASADDPTRLFLAVNYKPLYIQYNRKHEAIYFTSLEDYFGAEVVLDADVKSLQLPPYSTTEIDIRGNITTYQDPQPPKRRALCV
ncbi:MAG: 7-cyano-7-deazaguanine synthase, partial [Candidatus Bathyarchaeia archaeon]